MSGKFKLAGVGGRDVEVPLLSLRPENNTQPLLILIYGLSRN